MENKNQPAYPHYSKVFEVSKVPGFAKNHKQITEFEIEGGLTKRELTCIKCGIADTGDPELDKIILASERKKIAAMCLRSLLKTEMRSYSSTKELAKESILYADELLTQLNTNP